MVASKGSERTLKKAPLAAGAILANSLVSQSPSITLLVSLREATVRRNNLGNIVSSLCPERIVGAELLIGPLFMATSAVLCTNCLQPH